MSEDLQTPATVRESEYAETYRLVLDAEGTMGEPLPTGRTFRLRTIEVPGRPPVILSAEIQDAPGLAWVLQSGPGWSVADVG